MPRLFDLLAGFLARHRRACLIAILAATAAGLPGVARLDVDNSVGVWSLPEAPATRAYQRWRAVFGNDDWIVVAFRPAGDPLSGTWLAEVRRVTERLERLPGAGQAISLWSYYRDSRGIDGNQQPGEEELLAFAREVRASPFFENDLVRTSSGAAGIYFEVPRSDPGTLKRLGEAMRSLVEQEAATGTTLYWGGVSAIAMALDEASRREISVRFPLGVLVAVLVVWWSGMPWRALAVILVLAGTATLGSLGALAAAGHSLNMILTILPSLVFFVSLTYGVFVAHGLAGAGLSGDLDARLRRVFGPVFDSMASTVAGLLALLLSAFPVLGRLGLYGSLGVVLGMVLPFCAMPLVLPEGQRCDPGPSRRWARLRPVPVLVFWGLVLLAALPGIPRIQVEMDPLRFLPAASPLRQSFGWIGRELTGLSPVEVVLVFPKAVTDPAAFARLDTACERIRRLPGVMRLLGPADWLKRFHQNQVGDGFDPAAYRVPTDAGEIARVLASEDADRFLGRFVTKDLTTWHVHVRTNVEAALAFGALKARILAELRRDLPEARLETYGQHALIKEMETYLVSSTATSLVVAWFLIALILVARAPTVELGLWATVPNTLPILFVLAAMGYAGIPLDVGTSMVTAVATGLAADNTFHFMERWKTARGAGLELDAAIDETLAHGANPMVQSSLMTGTLFAVLSTSSFLPVVYFGVLNALSIFSSLLLDLTFLAAWLRVRRPDGFQ